MNVKQEIYRMGAESAQYPLQARKYSDVTATQLLTELNQIVGNGNGDDYDVFAQDAGIHIVNRITNIGDTISAPRIYYGG